MYSGRCPQRGGLLVSALCAAVLLSVVCGCGGAPGGGYDIVPVSGKVTWDDLSVIAVPELQFHFVPQVKPIDQKTFPRNGTAEVNVADGTFASVTTNEAGDGLIVGKHKVRLTAYNAAGAEEVLQVNPTEIEVGSGSTEFTFTVKLEE